MTDLTTRSDARKAALAELTRLGQEQDYFTAVGTNTSPPAPGNVSLPESPDLSGTNFRIPPPDIFDAARKVTRRFAENNIKNFTIAGIGPPADHRPHAREVLAYVTDVMRTHLPLSDAALAWLREVAGEDAEHCTCTRTSLDHRCPVHRTYSKPEGVTPTD